MLLGNGTAVWCHGESDSVISAPISCFGNSERSLFPLFCRAGVEVLFNELEIPVEEYSFGRSKIFIRNPRTVCRRNLSTPNVRRHHGDGSSKSVPLGDVTPDAAKNAPPSFYLEGPRGGASAGSWQCACVSYETSNTFDRTKPCRREITKNPVPATTPR